MDVRSNPERYKMPVTFKDFKLMQSINFEEISKHIFYINGKNDMIYTPIRIIDIDNDATGISLICDHLGQQSGNKPTYKSEHKDIFKTTLDNGSVIYLVVPNYTSDLSLNVKIIVHMTLDDICMGRNKYDLYFNNIGVEKIVNNVPIINPGEYYYGGSKRRKSRKNKSKRRRNKIGKGRGRGRRTRRY